MWRRLHSIVSRPKPRSRQDIGDDDSEALAEPVGKIVPKPRSRQDIGHDLDGIDRSKGVTGEYLWKLYKLTVERAEYERTWYHRKQRKFYWCSTGLRSFAALLLGASILLPLIQLVMKIDLITYSYIIAVVAGLLLSCDRFFLVTENWMVFTQVMLALEARIEAFRYEWHKRTVGLSKDTVKTEEAQELIDTCQKCIAEVLQEVGTETQRWRINLEKAAKDLSERVGKAAEEALQQKTTTAPETSTTWRRPMTASEVV